VIIHFLITQDLLSPGGRGRYLPWAKHLTRLGHTVFITALHSNYGELKEKVQILDSITIEYVAQMHVLKRGSHKGYFNLFRLFWIVLKSTIKLSYRATAQPARIIIVGKPHPMNGIAGILASIIRKTFLIVDVDDDEQSSGNFKYAWQRSFIGWFQNILLSRADLVITNTFYMRQKLIGNKVIPNKIYYLPNGVEQTIITYSDDELRKLREKLRLRFTYTVIFVGSLSLTNHPVLLLIDSFSDLLNINNDVNLLIVGGGESIDQIIDYVKNRKIDDKVFFVGKVDSSDVNKYYQIANLSVDPVFDDEVAKARCPLKLFESWANNIPFVTGDVGDRKILAGNPPAIALCKAGDAMSLAVEINKLLSSPTLIEELTKNGKDHVKNYHWDKLISDFHNAVLLGKEPV